MSFTLYYEPLDTLFFRDSRPFSAGDDTWAETVLPLPLTVFGSIGSYILKKNETDLAAFFSGGEDKTLGGYDETLSKTKMKIKGPFLSRHDQVYVPCPVSLVMIDGKICKKLKPDLNTSPKWDIEDRDLRPIGLPEGKVEPVVQFVSSEEVIEYLSDIEVCPYGASSEYLFDYERRFGHKLNRGSLTVEEGFLYSADHLRLRDSLESKRYVKTELMVFVDGIDASVISDSVVHIGGERRMARIRTADSVDIFPAHPDVIDRASETGRFLVCFLTPALFRDGFKRRWPEEFEEINAALVGAAVGKPVYMSGWRRTGVSKGRPRPLKRAVPAGSVYFFQAGEVDREKFKALYNKYNFNDSLSEEYTHAGFGIALIGTW